MARRRYGNKQQVKGGVLRRSKRRARAQGREELLKGGVTGAEARQLRSNDHQHNRGNVGGGIERRARQRLEQIGPVGGVNAHDGISRPEARKVRRAWKTEQQFNPLTPRNGRQIKSQAEAMVNLEYAPQEREIQHALKNETGRANVMSSWFQDYQNNVAQIARENQIAQKAFQDGAYAASQSAFEADTAAVGQRQQQDAKQGVNPDVAMQAQQAAGARQQQGIAFGNALGQMGAAQTGLMNQRVIGAGQQRMEVLAGSQMQQRKIGQLAQELAGDKGRSLTSTIGKLQDAEHTKQMEREAFGLDVQKAQADVADKRADNRRLARKDRRDAARDRLLNAQTRESIRTSKGKRALDRTADLADDGKRNHSQDYGTWKDNQGGGSGGTPDGFTQSQVRGNRSSFENGRDIAYRYRDKGYDWLVQSMQAKNYDSLMAKVIAMKATRKRIPRSLLNRFERRYGFRPSARGKGIPRSQQHAGSAVPRNPDGTPG